ncbi:hypothetical protein Forpe1208_v005619 [Fusarium oxysporum f. sp. rapae]|uniref:Uncharacterized protein n=1 Tax=Fusarium oxysporum f. sp. rapae TaxID=485398 RepID=A0A8J5PBQ2_FUSOX|nr:hypothetical protein Forpe1208_v005619 [Fusarium oxysporum f. sp. rapae]
METKRIVRREVGGPHPDADLPSLPPRGSPPRKRPKLTHNAATTPSVTKPKSVLDGIALIAEVRLNIYHQMVAIESTNHGFERDHLGRFLCPIDATGLAPYLNRSITKISGLRQEYLVEVFRLVVFIFTSSEHLKLFSEFIRSHFNLDPAQVPRLQAKVNFFHNDSFPQGVSLPRYRMVQIAHGEWERAYLHVRA